MGVMNAAEQETIGLCIALEAIDDIVNYALLDVLDSSVPGESTVIFKERIHQQMFVVRLLDFSKEVAAKSVTGVAGSCLDVLRAACDTRTFDVGGSIAGLAQSVNELQKWLNAPSSLNMWIPTLEVKAQLSVPRSQLLFILGNHVKHNLARLTRVSTEVANLLVAHNYVVTPAQVTLALEDIREHLQENYFAYYGTWLTELVNNVRWGLHDYLQPAFSRAFRLFPGDGNSYEYHYPASVSDGVARKWFWRLMNHVRRRPYVKHFVGPAGLKKTSSMEW